MNEPKFENTTNVMTVHGMIRYHIKVGIKNNINTGDICLRNLFFDFPHMVPSARNIVENSFLTQLFSIPTLLPYNAKPNPPIDSMWCATASILFDGFITKSTPK